MNEPKPAGASPVDLPLGPLPEPDLQTDPCSATGTQTDYYTAETVRHLLAAERELAVRVLADVLEASGANTLHGTREDDARTLLRLARERA